VPLHVPGEQHCPLFWHAPYIATQFVCGPGVGLLVGVGGTGLFTRTTVPVGAFVGLGVGLAVGMVVGCLVGMAVGFGVGAEVEAVTS
jgi:hypothetical protein